jgi:hypothetical protein
MSTQNNPVATGGDHGPKDKVQVQIVTVSGNYPDDGFQSYPAAEPLKAVLEQARGHLKLHDTGSWLAKLNGRVLDQNKSLADNGITGDATVMWGQEESGGGSEPYASSC